jgi:hypothetical protein
MPADSYLYQLYLWFRHHGNHNATRALHFARAWIKTSEGST